MSDSGWSNATIFKKYLEEHFLKYVQGHEDGKHVLVLYDGHSSHVGVPLIEWARDHRIILMVLPPHSSHLLQPLDVGLFGPLKLAFSSQCSEFMRTNPGRVITR